jgi:hypothetical protein
MNCSLSIKFEILTTLFAKDNVLVKITCIIIYLTDSKAREMCHYIIPKHEKYISVLTKTYNLFKIKWYEIPKSKIFITSSS